MKVLKFFVLFAFAATIVSCSNDDGPAPVTFEFNKANLLGNYQLESLQSKETKTQNVNGFDVTTVTEKLASTIDFSFEFSSDDQVTLNGNYVIGETKTQGTQQTDTTYIVNVNLLETPYSINEEDKTLTLDNKTYEVVNFSENGFNLKIHLEETLQNGTRVYTEELRLNK